MLVPVDEKTGESCLVVVVVVPFDELLCFLDVDLSDETAE